FGIYLYLLWLTDTRCDPLLSGETSEHAIRSLVLIGTQRVGWRRIWLDFFEDQSIAWCQMPGGVATVLRTPRPLGPSRGCAGDSSCCRKRRRRTWRSSP